MFQIEFKLPSPDLSKVLAKTKGSWLRIFQTFYPIIIPLRPLAVDMAQDKVKSSAKENRRQAQGKTFALRLI